MSELLQNLFNGAVASGIYLFIAVGITFVFGLTRLINFAHGQFLVMATFVCAELVSRDVPFVVATLAATVVAAVLGLLSERLLFRFTLNNPYNGLIIGLGLLLVLEAVTVDIWEGLPVSIPNPVSGGFEAGGAFFSWTRLTWLIVAIAVALGLVWALRGSRLGHQLRAAHENPIAAAHVGVNVGRMVTVAMVVGSGLAGLAGAALGTLFPVSPFDGGNIILKGFAVALLGGLGNVSGAMKAALIYGLGETAVGAYVRADWIPFFTYGVIVVVLLFRPGGLFESSIPEPTFSRNALGRVKNIRRLARGERWIAVVASLMLGPIVFEMADSTRTQSLLLLAALYAIQVYALAYVYETTGILSIAQAGMMAIGAYTAGALFLHFGFGFWPSVLLAIPCSAIVGALLGIVVARCTGHYLLLVTLAFSALISQFAVSLVDLTRGDDGIIISKRIPKIAMFEFDSIRSQFYLAFVVCVLAAVGLALVKRTRFGHQLAAIRENEVLARSLGLRVAVPKTLIFALSAAVSGLGGVLYLYMQRVIVPNSFGALISIQFVIMLVLGGTARVGPAAGALAFVMVPEFFDLSPAGKQLAFGAALMLVILLIPAGLVPSLRAAYTFVRDRLLRRDVRSELPSEAGATDAARRVTTGSPVQSAEAGAR